MRYNTFIENHPNSLQILYFGNLSSFKIVEMFNLLW